MNIQTVFKPKQEKIAECIAYLTNSVISKDEKGNLVLVNKSEINEKIAQMLEKKDFIGAAELLESAKKLLKEPVHEAAEVVSKSIRLPFPTYLKLIEVAQKKNMSLADAIRITSILTMKSRLNEFRDNPAVDQEKLGVMYNLLEEWRAKKSTSAYKEYSPEFRYGSGMSDSFNKFIKFSIYDMCEDDFPRDLMKEYLQDNLDFLSFNTEDWYSIDPVTDLVFDTQSNSFELLISIQNEIYLNKYNAFKESIDDKLHKIFDEILDFEHRNYDEDKDYLISFIGGPGITSISGTLRIENNKLFFDGVDIKQRDALNALIYEKIAIGSEKYAEFKVDECIKQVQEALARNDYDTAAQLNEKLARFQVTSKIAGWYGDIIASIAEGSNVVTFTIPKLLLLLWEATKGDRGIQEFVEENLQEA